MDGYGELGWRTPLLWVCIAATIVLALIGDAITVSFGEDELATNMGMSIVLAVSGLGGLAMFVASIVAVGIWTHRAMANAHALSEDVQPSISPGWAVGYYFVPFVNLYQPFKAMQEIHGASTGEISSGLLTAWWGTWVAGNVLGNVAFRFDSAEVGLASACVSFMSGVLLILVTKQVHEGQAEKERAMVLARTPSVSTYRERPGPGIPG
jgi:hypothetical protein